MIIKEMVQRVQSLYSKGVQSDDTRLSKRHIFSKLLTGRARLITQRINKRQPVTQWSYQTLDCVALVKAPPYECPCLPAVGCTILKTKLPLPAPLMGIFDGHAIQSVTSVEGSIVFSETTWKAKKYASGSKYTSTKPDFYIRNNYLYVTSKVAPKVISITGLFENPLEVYAYPSICGEVECKENKTTIEYPVFNENEEPSSTSTATGFTPDKNCPECVSPLDQVLPIDKGMVETLIELSANELIAIFNQGQEDTSNDSRDTPKEQAK
jgi:hypothetical protein